MRVRQARTYPIWRVSHPYDPDVATRLVVWFPDDEHAVVVAFAGDKARIGNGVLLERGQSRRRSNRSMETGGGTR